MIPESAERRTHRTKPEDERAQSEFLDAVASLTRQDVAHRIEADLREKETGDPPQRKGEERIVETVDLHRLTGEQATRRLRAAFSRLKGRQGLVRVIVGKGIHSPESVGVLREIVPAWMDGSGRQFVAEWRWAGPKEGGQGALIVRLRRPRSSDRS